MASDEAQSLQPVGVAVGAGPQRQPDLVSGKGIKRHGSVRTTASLRQAVAHSPERAVARALPIRGPTARGRWILPAPVYENRTTMQAGLQLLVRG